MSYSGPKLLIFDVDGTLRWTMRPGGKYPLRADEWRLMPHVNARMAAIPWGADGPFLAIASNQCGVGEGHLTRETALALIEDTIVSAVGFVPPGARIEICTCAEGANCARQKPRPGLLLAHLHHFGFEPADALYIGDLDIDRDAAAAACVPFMTARAFFDPARELPW